MVEINYDCQFSEVFTAAIGSKYVGILKIQSHARDQEQEDQWIQHMNMFREGINNVEVQRIRVSALRLDITKGLIDLG